MKSPGKSGDGGGWQPLGGPALAGVLVFAFLSLWFGNSGDRWLPLLDGANLLFHEFGHPFVGLFSERLAVYGGTLAQFVFPLATAWKFRAARATASFAVCVVWGFQNLFSVARYVADARAKVLPLAGGRDPEFAHDWAEILSRWGWLDHDTQLAAWVSAIGWFGIVACCLWVGRRWARDRAT